VPMWEQSNVDRIKSQALMQRTLSQHAEDIGQLFGSEVIFLKGSILPLIDETVKDEIEHIKAGRTKKKLTVFIETDGGVLELVERIVAVFREHYKSIEYVVPNYALSAGTVLALSGDKLYMNYYSVLGPIDPQVRSDDSFLPGMGYLAKFESLVRAINASDPRKVRAEMAFLLNKFDPAKLFFIEQAVEHSKSLLVEWLPKHLLRSVKDTNLERRAADIARRLGDPEKWHSHGRGISIQELRRMKVPVTDYGKVHKLNGLIPSYYALLKEYLDSIEYPAAVHSSHGLRRIVYE
jgi:Serine dehydrogenase proteinase